MHIVTIHKAKTNLSKLIQQALKGEEIVISKGKIPMVKLTVCEEAKKARKLGTGKKLFTLTDDFNEPLNDFEEYI